MILKTIHLLQDILKNDFCRSLSSPSCITPPSLFSRLLYLHLPLPSLFFISPCHLSLLHPLLPHSLISSSSLISLFSTISLFLSLSCQFFHEREENITLSPKLTPFFFFTLFLSYHLALSLFSRVRIAKGMIREKRERGEREKSLIFTFEVANKEREN